MTFGAVNDKNDETSAVCTAWVAFSHQLQCRLGTLKYVLYKSPTPVTCTLWYGLRLKHLVYLTPGGGGTPLYIWAILVCAAPKGWFFYHSGLSLNISFTRSYFFRFNIGKFVALLSCFRQWKPFLVSCGHVLEPYVNILEV